jgi:integrase
MNYLFELRKDKTNKNGLIPVRIVITSGKIKIRKNLSNVKTLLEDWDIKSEVIRNNKKHPFFEIYKIANTGIQQTKEKLENISNFFKFNNIPFAEDIFFEKFDKGDISVAIDFFEAFTEFINVSKHTKAVGTITKYTTVKNFLSQFHDFTKYPIRFDTINQRFEEKFMDYAYEERKTLNNYYGKLISIIKTFMNWSFERGYHNNIEFKKLKRIENEIEVIFLEKDELFKLYKHDFENERLNKSRDFFCFGCFTGLRHSDINNIDQANIYDDFIQLTLIKTKTINHRVELNIFSKAILEKYKGTIYEPLPKISSQKLNKNIQDCCEIIKLDNDVTITRHIGSKRITKTFKKYELISSHIARKTFVTNSLLFGMNERVLREMTHHKDEKSFKRYVDISNFQKNKEMANTWNINSESE